MKNNKIMNSAEYIEVTLRIEPFSEEAAEIVEAELCDLPYDSFVIEEDALKAYIPKDAYDARALKVVLSGVPYKTSFNANLVPYQNWNRQWENEFEPIIVGRDVTVKAWHHTREDLILAYAAMGKPLGKTRFTIKIDPQMAFGTGHHQTTYMMMEAMMEIEDRIRGHVVMDMGCGTGVLGILAAKLHAAHVYGIDIDAVAAQSAYDNAHGNRVARHFETYYGDASLLQMGKYDVLLANIHKNIIIMDLRTYARSLRAGGTLLCSGFYADDIPAIRQEAEANGLRYVSERLRDGWACVRFEKA